MPERFNEILSRLRREKGVSQRAAAAELGISQALLSHYEKGVREPGLAFLVQACEYYCVSADYILGRSAYRWKIDFTPEQLADAELFAQATTELARAAFTLKVENDKKHVASLLSAMLYSLDQSGEGDPRLADALITLRRAQLSGALSEAGFTLPDALRRGTEEELSMLFDK